MVQEKILEAVKHEELRVYVVWTSVLQEDDRQAAVKAIGKVPDERAIHFWDADKSLGFSLGKTVVLPRGRELAWDVYFAFERTAKWDEVPPKPADWMHQLGTDQRTLDGNKLRQAIEELLKESE